MAKLLTKFVCQACGHEATRWVGKCPDCGGFSTFAEEKVTVVARAAAAHAAARSAGGTPPRALAAYRATPIERVSTGIPEFDRVLGGGVVPGSLVLIGGDPGIGKSTLLIESSVRLAERWGSGLYISGEESVEQVSLRARRLDLDSSRLLLAAETDLVAIEGHIRDAKPGFAVIDSIQTVAHPGLDSAPGTLTQVREAAMSLQRLAKESGTAIFIVGHVNKEGNLAGPRALEHIVDTVLQLEGDEHRGLRILRASKNRFGSTHELGIFEMTERGMEGVANPSQLFLSERRTDIPGSVVVATVEGARPLLVEVQALCAPSYFTSPRRTVTGADFNRVNVVLAVVEKRLGMRLGDMDVFVNVVGGIRVTEPALDIGIALAVVSSLRDRAVPAEVCAFGEIGLGGEVRAVAHAERRANEAARLGFARCVAPRATGRQASPRGGEMRTHTVATLHEAIQTLFPEALERTRAPRAAPPPPSRARDVYRNGVHSEAAVEEELFIQT